MNIQLPPVLFGTSSLGNLYRALDYETKRNIISECMQHSPKPVVFDTAGKYGAGLALETLGKCLKELGADPGSVIISNKLGWYRTALKTPEPTFEKDVWIGLEHDAEQRISAQGILDCMVQGNELLGDYAARMLSVHDPDEYLKAAVNENEREKRLEDILDAYRALTALKKQGKVDSIGIGAKDWRVVREISGRVDLDWVMIANSLTILSHPQELISFIQELKSKKIAVINSAVFHGGFLTGSDFFDYQKVDEASPKGQQLLGWRENFYALCGQFDIQPAEACVNFGFNIPGVTAIAMNTTRPEKVRENIGMVDQQISPEFWMAMKELIKENNYESIR